MLYIHYAIWHTLDCFGLSLCYCPSVCAVIVASKEGSDTQQAYKQYNPLPTPAAYLVLILVGLLSCASPDDIAFTNSMLYFAIQISCCSGMCAAPMHISKLQQMLSKTHMHSAYRCPMLLEMLLQMLFTCPAPACPAPPCPALPRPALKGSYQASWR